MSVLFLLCFPWRQRISRGNHFSNSILFHDVCFSHVFLMSLLYTPFILFCTTHSILRNKTWYGNQSVIDFISRIGRNVRLGDMLSRTSVKERIESEEGMSYSEFSYQVFQAYDWLVLQDKYNCTFQVINLPSPTSSSLVQRFPRLHLPNSQMLQTFWDFLSEKLAEVFWSIGLLAFFPLLSFTLPDYDPFPFFFSCFHCNCFYLPGLDISFMICEWTRKVGGSDQLGNITTGYQLIRKLTQKEAFGLVTSLLTDELGSKYGKSTGSKVWLSRNKMSAFDFYQYFVRIHDTEVLKFLKLFTFIPEAEIEKIMAKFLKKTDSRYAQERLAEAVTLLVHGESGLESAKKTTAALFDNDLQAISRMTVEEMQEVFASSALVCHLYLEPGETTVLDVAMKAKCFDNEKYASNIIQAGGFFINYKKITSPSKLINEEDDILANDTSLIRVGKRRYYIIKWRWMKKWHNLNRLSWVSSCHVLRIFILRSCHACDTTDEVVLRQILLSKKNDQRIY